MSSLFERSLCKKVFFFFFGVDAFRDHLMVVLKTKSRGKGDAEKSDQRQIFYHFCGKVRPLGWITPLVLLPSYRCWWNIPKVWFSSTMRSGHYGRSSCKSFLLLVLNWYQCEKSPKVPEKEILKSLIKGWIIPWVLLPSYRCWRHISKVAEEGASV